MVGLWFFFYLRTTTKGNDLLSLVLHLHGAQPVPNAPDRELDASGYRDLPGKYRVMVAAPRAVFNQTVGTFGWNSFFSLVGCGPRNEDDVGFLNSLLTKLLATYPIHPQRVYIYGYSSGANMASPHGVRKRGAVRGHRGRCRDHIG
jgi:poly(3-hydroxybutyrate) depolymerase